MTFLHDLYVFLCGLGVGYILRGIVEQVRAAARQREMARRLMQQQQRPPTPAYVAPPWANRNWSDPAVKGFLRGDR